MTIEKKDYSSFFVFLSTTFCRALMVFQTFRYLKGPSGRIRVLKMIINFFIFLRPNAKMYQTPLKRKTMSTYNRKYCFNFISLRKINIWWDYPLIGPCTLSRFIALPIAMALSLAMFTLSLVLPSQYSIEILLSLLFWSGKTCFIAIFKM